MRHMRAVSARRFWAVWTAGLAVWAIGLIMIAPHDLTIAQAVYNPQSIPARAVALAGEWPLWIVFLGSLGALAFHARLFPNRPRYRDVATLIVLQAIVHPFLITQALKRLWGRVRFRDLSPGLLDYTHFYEPAGPGAGQSFPSGHVAMSLILAPLVFYVFASQKRAAALALLGAVSAYGLFVSYCRMVTGAHYPTDVAFSFGCSFLVAALIVRYVPTGLER